MNEQVTQ